MRDVWYHVDEVAGICIVFHSDRWPNGWAKLWDSRWDDDSSEATRFLRLLPVDPEPKPRFTNVKNVDARNLVQQLAEKSPYKVLSLRRRSTYNGGEKEARRVMDELGLVYKSIRAAARAWKISPSIACKWVRNGKLKIVD